MSIEPVRIDFAVGGIGEVKKSLGAISDALEKAERQGVRGTQRATQDRIKAADKERKERERMYADLFKQVDKAEKDKVRAAERSAKETVRAQLAADKEISRAIREGVRETEKAEKDKTRAVERAARERLRAESAAEREYARLKQELARDTAREERAQNAESRRWMRERLQEQRRQNAGRERLAGSIGGMVARGASSAGNLLLGGGMRVAGEMLSLGGGFSVSDSVKDRLELETGARNLVNAGYIPKAPGAAGQRQDPAKVIAEMRATAIARGLDAREINEGLTHYVASSSDLEGGRKNLDFFAKVAKGTGSKFADVTGAAGQLKAQNKDMTDKEMQSMLLTIIQQGKLGHVLFSDLAGAAGKITKTSSAYGENQTLAQSQLLGMAQLAARVSGGSVDSAATYTTNLAMDTMAKRKKLEAKGIKVTNKAGDLLDPETIMANVFEKTKGNMSEIKDLGFGNRSFNLFEALAPVFKEKGMKGLHEDISSLTGAQYDEKELDEDFKNVMSAPGEQLENEVRKLNDAIGAELLPEVTKLIPEMAKLTPKFVDLVRDATKLAEYFAHNPLTGLGALISAFIMKELAAAAIGEVVKRSFISMMGGAGFGGGALGGAGRLLGAAGAIGTVAAAATAAGIAGIDYLADRSVTRQQKAFGTDVEAENAITELTVKSRAGTLSKDDIEKAKQLREVYGKNVSGRQAEGGPGMLESAAASVTSFFGSDAGKQKIANDEAGVKRSAELLEKLNAALEGAAKRLNNVGGGAGDPGAPNRNSPMSSESRGGTNH